MARVDELAGPSGVVTDGDWVESKDQDPEGAVRLTQLADVGEGEFRDRSRRYMTVEAADRLNCTYLEPNDVLIARMPDPLGRACIFPGLDQLAVTAVDVMIWRTDGRIADASWFVYWINSPSVRSKMVAAAGGTTRQRVAGGRIKELALPLPPFAEQRRIVAKLDALISQVALARRELVESESAISSFRRSVLKSAFRADTQQHRAWQWKRASEVCAKVQSGGTPKVGFTDSGVPFLKIYNIVNQRIDFDHKSQFVTPDTHARELKKSITRAGDVLMNIVGPPLGKVALVPNTPAEWNINQALCLFRPGPNVLSEWIYYYLCSGISVDSIFNETRGIAGQVNISLSQCRDFLFPIPDLTAQERTVQFLKKTLAQTDRLEAEAARARAVLDGLEAAILAKAFRGELVRQDPNDEPASALLERIRAERAAAPTPGRRKRARA